MYRSRLTLSAVGFRFRKYEWSVSLRGIVSTAFSGSQSRVENSQKSSERSGDDH